LLLSPCKLQKHEFIKLWHHA